jgi:hypothetical protein
MARTKPCFRIRISTPLVSSFLSFAVAPAAMAEAVSTTVPFMFSVANPCTAEDLLVSGNLHFLVSGTLSASGMAQSHLQTSLQGAQATGILTGARYQVPLSETDSDELDTTDAAPFNVTQERIVQFVRVGEDGTFVFGDDFYEHFLVHATVNANGVVTVDDFTTDTRCR